MADAYPGDLWFVVPADGPEQEFHNPTRAHMALAMLGGAGRMESCPAATRVRKVVAVSDADGNITAPATDGVSPEHRRRADWFVVPADGGPEEAFYHPTTAHAALIKLGKAGRVESYSLRTGELKTYAERDDEGSWSSPLFGSDQVENGFPVRYMSNDDGDRFVCIDPQEFDMSGWRVEVGFDPDWNPSFGGWTYHPSEYDRGTRVEEFTRDDSIFLLTFNPWSASVDRGRKIVRWIPPGDA